MRLPSRLLPKLEQKPKTLWSWLAIAALLGGTALLLYIMFSKAPWVSATAVAALVGWSIYGARRTRKRLEAVAASRQGESICGFARSFDTRAVDTWVVRAVYEELQRELSAVAPNFPVRASDRLLKDLLEDSDDLDMSVAPNIAKRTGRSLDGHPGNPYFGKVETVRDLVHFFNAQPRQSATEPMP